MTYNEDEIRREKAESRAWWGFDPWAVWGVKQLEKDEQDEEGEGDEE